MSKYGVRSTHGPAKFPDPPPEHGIALEMGYAYKLRQDGDADPRAWDVRGPTALVVSRVWIPRERGVVSSDDSR